MGGCFTPLPAGGQNDPFWGCFPGGVKCSQELGFRPVCQSGRNVCVHGCSGMSSGQPGCACRAADMLHRRHGATRSCAQDGCLAPGMGNPWDMVVQDVGIPDVMVVRRAGWRDVRWHTRRADRRPGRRTHARFASDHVPQRAACARALHNHRRVIVILHDVVGTPRRGGDVRFWVPGSRGLWMRGARMPDRRGSSGGATEPLE